MRFCSLCAQPLRQRVPDGDTHLRFVCDACGTIHYQNPKLVVGAIAEWEGRILLCRRAIEPRRGLWTLPAGFMENHETTQDAARRETREEACASVELHALFSLVDVPHISQVHLFYRGAMTDGAHAPGVESLETRLFDESEIPWDLIAFRSVALSLRAYLADRRAGAFGTHTESLSPPPEVAAR